MKTKRSLYNSIASLGYYIITILLGIVNRKYVIHILGIEYQGINGLFSNVLSMLSIAELGIGTTIIFHLYKPLHDRNIPVIRSLMQFYKKCYLAIAAGIAVIGLLLIPCLDFFVAENTLPYSLAGLYIWFLLDAVVSYLFTYKRSILIADQKNFVVTGCDLAYQFGVKLGQIAVLLITRNFIAYLIFMVFARIAENLFLNALSEKMYPFLKEAGAEKLSPEILKDIRQKVKGTVFHKVGGFIVTGKDNILISKFMGLAAAGIYSNYFLIINALKNICTQMITAATASVGHMLAEGSREKNYEVFMEMQILNGGIVNCAAAGIYSVATPLISIVFGTEFTLSDGTLFVLAFNFYIQGIRNVFGIFKEAGGILYEDRFVPLIESAVNLAASLFLMKLFGLSGIFLGTILSSTVLFCYTYPKFVYVQILHQTLREYIKEILWLLAVACVSLGMTWKVMMMTSGLALPAQIAVRFLWSAVIPNILFICIYGIHHKEFGNLLTRIQKLFHSGKKES